MSKVEIYATQTCPYCHRAKRLLERKGVAFVEIDVGGRSDLRDEMTRRADGRTSVPQIFIDGQHVGGCDDLHDLDARGKLDPMLERAT
ncbi:MAG: glutaredoxin 3 [Alphaproteobacteria bacterium]|nr:glutaredoxin 3 [Alphaproteobacteria bacterium]